MAIPGSRQNRPGGSGSQDKRGYPRSKDDAFSAPNRPYQEERRPVVSSHEAGPVEAAPATNPASNFDGQSAFTNQEVRELVKLVHDNDITELVLERDNGAQRLVIKRKRPTPAPVMLPPQVAGLAQAQHDVPISLSTNPAPASAIPDPGAPPQDSFHKVVAPMVGTFYRGPDPKDTPFVQEGDMVERDQVIGIIEAMKIMNEIKSDHRGRCVRISVENGQPVEYGQTLMLLEPA
ncbi:MAG: biotin carboxyl carrier protein [Chloroflexi bacterium]|jgi:acetyl-CoA carboxylase biotin carboxyl carrier protein|nr:biotin carboxyl carrier protein [Chloroflexota bacterium]